MLLIYFLHSFPFYCQDKFPPLPPQCFWSISMVFFFIHELFHNYLLQLLWCHCKFLIHIFPPLFPGLFRFFFFIVFFFVLVLEQNITTQKKSTILKTKTKIRVYRICFTFFSIFFWKDDLKLVIFFPIFKNNKIFSVFILYRPQVLKGSKAKYSTWKNWREKGRGQMKMVVVVKGKRKFFFSAL